MGGLLEKEVADGITVGGEPHKIDSAHRDVAIVIAMALVTWILCATFEINETLFRWSRFIEQYQLDELPIVLLVLTAGLLWFSIRRYREGNEMWRRQRVVDDRLSIALDENRRLARQYLNALESERKQLARELHDELGQYLNAIKLDAVAVRQAVNESCEPREFADSIERNADHVYSFVAELIRQLRPAGLDELGLVAAVENLIDSWRQRLPSTKIAFSMSGNLDDLSEHANLTLFRIVQEALTNVAKHSQANNVSVRLSKSPLKSGQSVVAVDVEDDGRGFDLAKPREGFGLVGMRERVEMHGGAFLVSSVPQKGVVLNASFPAAFSP